MKNNSLSEIGKVLSEAKRVIIFPHKVMDADAFGSATALANALKNLGKEVKIALEDGIAKNIQFLDEGFTENYQDIKWDNYISVCVDCGSLDRFPKRKELFLGGSKTICLDHHKSSQGICDYNFIDSKAAATGEIIFKLLHENSWKITEQIADALFAAISTDTGNFRYSSTKKHTHEIISKLYDVRDDFNHVSIELYEKQSLSSLLLQADIIEKMIIGSDGRFVISYVSQEMLEKNNASMDDSEGVVAILRSIDGVEVSALLKENSKDEIKVSLRSKYNLDVAEISESFGGGGHKKAAGFTLMTSLDEATETVRKTLENVIEHRK